MAAVPDRASIDTTTAELEDDLVALRRDIHRWPELAGDERRTAALVADRLRAAGLAVSVGVGGQGVVAVLDGERDGPTVAYRADLDAVPSSELYGSDFASQVPGVAHLCGHDVHTAIGVGVAQVFARLRHRLSGRVVFVFQPAEENVEGARAMLADGALDRIEPQEIYALHCSPLPVGAFAVMPGYGLPGQDTFDIEVSGSDAARLRAAIDALSTVQRPQTPEQYARLVDDLQRPDGPLARFVFVRSDLTEDDRRAQIRVSVRAWPHDRYPEIRAEVRRLVESVDGARVTFVPEPFPPMVCSPQLSNTAADFLRGTLGPQSVTVLHAAFPFNGEDFGLFLQRVPGAMLYLGVADPAAGINGVAHAPDFAADERAIGVGVRAMTGLLSHRLHALGAR
ncbi:M20 family metallopeptidase [Dactylosporangium cerinum]|uniref:M20 family metallopeptidase n=1 Tax=Dactylosporangium cerinum TaxID=1434730 RepID=A0ABV9VMM7_9ACTN